MNDHHFPKKKKKKRYRKHKLCTKINSCTEKKIERFCLRSQHDLSLGAFKCFPKFLFFSSSVYKWIVPRNRSSLKCKFISFFFLLSMWFSSRILYLKHLKCWSSSVLFCDDINERLVLLCSIKLLDFFSNKTLLLSVFISFGTVV